MGNFEEKLSLAIKTVFEKFNSMSSEDLDAVIERYDTNEGAFALLCALDTSKYERFVHCETLSYWTNIVEVDASTYSVCPEKCETSSFSYPEGNTSAFSDDYFFELAA